MRYPPTTGCPWCGHPDAAWTAVEGRGAVYTYAEVHHAIQPAFQQHLPYLILIVELDTQRGVPGEDDALRIARNLVPREGDLAPAELVAKVGIGTRVRMVFRDVAAGLAVPLWAIDESADQSTPWRYPGDVLAGTVSPNVRG